MRGAVFFDEKKKGLDQILYSLGIDDVEVGKQPSKYIYRERFSNLLTGVLFHNTKKEIASASENILFLTRSA